MRELKSELRKLLRNKRKTIDGKAVKDKIIIENLLSLELYQNCKTLLCYASLDEEIATDDLINNAIDSGKTVAVPCCSDTNGNMDFYIINSLSDLQKGTFGVREPDKEKAQRLENFYKSIIIVPAITFDKKGYRLGYGRGYYDKYLADNRIMSVGLCYEALVSDELPRDEHDVPVDMIITEKRSLSSCIGGKNG